MSRRRVRSKTLCSTVFTDKQNIIGVFGVPLELLVEREGADSLLGASRATLKVPSFIDDVISAMRQMGQPAIMNSSPKVAHIQFVD
jgi:hypothetical protein